MFLSMREVGEKVGLPSKTIYMWKQAGLLPHKVMRTTEGGRELLDYDLSALVCIRLIYYLRKRKKYPTEIINSVFGSSQKKVAQINSMKPKRLFVVIGESEDLCGLLWIWSRKRKRSSLFKDEGIVDVSSLGLFNITGLYECIRGLIEKHGEKFLIPHLEAFSIDYEEE